jgi:pilus assembly protein CpaD
MTLTRTLLVAAAFTLAALCLAACASPATGPVAIGPLNPGAQYALRADPAVDQIALAVHEGGLSPAQVQAVRALAERRRENGGGPVELKLPGKTDLALAGRVTAAVRVVLGAEGVPQAEVRAGVYDAPEASSPLLVSYAYAKAKVPTCGRNWDDLTDTGENSVYANFGCATTANMAAQIANPSDILHPHAEDPSDAERRLTVLGKYKAGKTTAADEPDAKYSGQIAHVGQ